MLDEKQYKIYIETARFWQRIEERINNCITYLRNDTNQDKSFIELVIMVLRSAENMCAYRAKVMYEKVHAWETLFGEEKNNA